MPEQIASNWDFLKRQVVDGGPLESQKGENRYNNILNSLLLGDMQCWVETELDGKGFHIQAVVLTQVLTNDCAGVKNLIIYSLIGIEDLFNAEKWRNALLTLAQFARKHSCQHIVAYSDNPRVIKMAEKLKANASQRLLVFSLN